MTRLRTVRTPTAGREGLTLVEALIAVSILTILLAAVIPAFTDALRINTRSEVRSQAVAAAQTVLDSLRAVPPAEWPAYAGGDPPVQQVEAGRRTFDVTVRYQEYCDAGGDCFDNAREIDLEVSFRDEVRYSVSTVYTELRAP